MQNLETDNVKLAVLEEKVFNMVEVISKLDDTIDKLSDLSVNVSKMLAVHEEKLEFARESAAETAKDMGNLEGRLGTKVADVANRISTLERKVWMGMGGISFFFVTLMLLTPVLTERVYSDGTPAIIEVDPKK